MPTTRLGSSGFGVKRYGSFAGRVAVSGPVTRLGSSGFGVRRYGDFSGRTEVVAAEGVFNYPIHARRVKRR